MKPPFWRSLSVLFAAFVAGFAISGSGSSAAGEVTAAVAANFVPTMHRLSEAFEARTGHNIRIVSGSTGKHYAQILQGAPYDVFFAADAVRPARLEQEGHAKAGTRFTYAMGRLILWSPVPGRITREGTELVEGNFHRLAIANPKLAPYGTAAQEVLMDLGIWHQIQHRLVRGTNISQTLQFVQTGAAEFGFVALAQLQQPGQEIGGSYWLVPQTAHTPIEQQAVILKDSEAARALMAFIQSDSARVTIEADGYGSTRGEDEQ